MHSKYPNLFTPINIGPLKLRSRIISSPTSQGDLEKDGSLAKHNIAYYARKAKGGAALVTVGDCIVHQSGQNHPLQTLLFNNDCMSSLVRVADEIHKYGALASCQLSHGGIVSDPAYTGYDRPWGPSEVEVTIGFQTTNPVKTMSSEMTEEQILEVVEAYGVAAARAANAGFDLVMIHGAHGWLLSQFMSPLYNKRTDKYGGSVENRARFPLMVVKRVREAIGRNMAIDFRINGADGDPNGLKVEESAQICKILEPYVDSFHVSQCLHAYIEHQDIQQSTIYVPRHHNLHLAAYIKASGIKKPIATVGGFCDPAMMESVVAEGKADIVAVGRQFLADPDFPKKAKYGCEDEIRTCLRCQYCQHGRFTRTTARCAINPEIGYEYDYQFEPPKTTRRKVLVAGGGPGGMEAAITAAKRGHDVTLYEKSDKFGGALNFAEHIPVKVDIYSLIGAMEAQLKRQNVRIVMNTALTPEIAEDEHPDVIISAIGADSIVPPIPGIDSSKVLLAEDVDKGAEVGDKIVVIGGGLVGIETALDLAEKGKEVTIVEMLPDIANDANIRYNRTFRWKIAERNIKVYTSTACTAVTDEGISATDSEGKEISIPCDNVILAVGMRAREEESEALRYIAPLFIPIGNCVRAGQIKDAIHGGFDAAMYLDQLLRTDY